MILSALVSLPTHRQFLGVVLPKHVELETLHKFDLALFWAGHEHFKMPKSHPAERLCCGGLRLDWKTVVERFGAR